VFIFPASSFLARIFLDDDVHQHPYISSNNYNVNNKFLNASHYISWLDLKALRVSNFIYKIFTAESFAFQGGDGVYKPCILWYS
ncbi:MAG: hypothetical protein RQ855_02495, partial [Desulfurococcales archaeon]|nr:hypothetical protein [Desulfurococcales archaeon]